MKKTIRISIIAIVVLVLAIIGYYNIYTKKQWEVPGEVSKTLPSETDSPKPSLGGKNIKQANTHMAFERPAHCMELMKKRSESTDFSGGLTGGEEGYLRDICRIPITISLSDIISVLKWWKDEYGYEDMMYVNIDELSGFLKIPGSELAGVVKPLMNIALNSRFPVLRGKAVIALHEITREKSIPTFIDRKKSIPIIKEVLRKEVEDRGVTQENRRSVIYWTGRFLSEEGEYEYAFPYLMKAKIFEISSRKGDKRAISYMYDALQTNDSCIKSDAVFWLATIGEQNDKVLTEAIGVLQEAVTKKKEITGCTMTAIFAVKKLKDKRAIPILNKIVRVNERGYEAIEAKKAIEYIMQKGGE